MSSTYAGHRTRVRNPREGQPRRGAAVVELAIFAVPLLLIVFGTIDICQSIHRRQDALIVAFEGARTRSIRSMTTQDAIDICRRLMRDRGIPNARLQFRFPEGEESGARFECRVTVSPSTFALPLNLVLDDMVVSRHAMID